MALAGKYSPEIEALLDKLQRSGATFDRSKVQVTQRTKDTPERTYNIGRNSRQSTAPATRTPQIEALLDKLQRSGATFDRSKVQVTQRTAEPAPSPTQSLFGKDSFSGLDAPPTKAYTKEEYDGIIANAMAAGRARNNVKPGTEYDLGGEPNYFGRR